ncbi:MAG: manganese efflux pump, partial [Bacteriovoracaceae bacterium]|nr:manganese efflux pump [Bacteriovoracaceae bacterium]
MSFSLLLIIAISLGVDAMVVSLSCGLKVGRIIWPAYLKIALAFGIFQGLMTAIGLGLGHLGYVFFQPYAHLIATGFFLGLAGKSLHEFIKQNKSPKLNKLPELLTQNEDRSP